MGREHDFADRTLTHLSELLLRWQSRLCHIEARIEALEKRAEDEDTLACEQGEWPAGETQ